MTSGNRPHSAPPGVLAPLVEELVGKGALAVWLAGSHARQEASRHSDIDIGVIAPREGMGPGYRLERRDGHLVSVAWATAAATRASFVNPAVLGAAVPGWRGAALLHDPDGIGAALRDEARVWTWEPVAVACDAWVAEEVAGLAEEVHKLVAALEGDRRFAAAVQRNVLALRLAMILSVYRRLLYDSENVLWDLVAEAEGPAWAALQRAAFAEGGEPFAASTRAALAMYEHASGSIAALFDDRQRVIVEHARSLIAATIAEKEQL